MYQSQLFLYYAMTALLLQPYPPRACIAKDTARHIPPHIINFRFYVFSLKRTLINMRQPIATNHQPPPSTARTAQMPAGVI